MAQRTIQLALFHVTGGIYAASSQDSRIGIAESRSSDRGLFPISRIKPVYESASLKFVDER